MISIEALKKYFFLILIISLNTRAFAQSTIKKQAVDIAQKVEAACGQCQFGLKGKGCDLAIRIDGKGYFVDGTKIDEHGDAHAKDGFCNAIRKADVKGKITGNRFVATSFTLLSVETKTETQ